MPFLDEVRKELQKEGNHQQPDMHAVHIGIGGHDYLIISESVQAILDIQGRLQKVELLVLIHHLLGESEGVEGFASEREHRLGVHVAALGDTSAGRRWHSPPCGRSSHR